MYSKKTRAGGSTREMANKRHNKGLWILIIGILAAVVIWLLIRHSFKQGIGVGVVIVLIIIFQAIPDIVDSYSKRVYKEEKRAIRGAIAEETIGEIVDELPEEDFFVINDISNPNGNIDHIVISRVNGIFLIETKSHHGKVDIQNGTLLINGKLPEKDFIAQTLKNTYWLKNHLYTETGIQAWITPVIVFTNAFVVYSPPVKGIIITNKKYLPNLLNRPARINPQNAKIWEERENIQEFLS